MIGALAFGAQAQVGAAPERIPGPEGAAAPASVPEGAPEGVPRGGNWLFEPSVAAKVTTTDNVFLAESADKRSDTYLEVSPRLVIRREGARLSVRGSADFTGIAYANDSEQERIVPRGSLAATLEAIERFFFVDAAASATQRPKSLFAPRTGTVAGSDSQTLAQYRLSPYVLGRIGTDVEYSLRTDNAWTDAHGGDSSAADAAYLGHHVFRISRAPRPLGWEFNIARTDTRFESDFDNQIVEDAARLRLAYSPNETISFGARGGYERNNFSVENRDSAIWGADLGWRPGPRTSLDGRWEHRYFGSGWSASFSHRMTKIVWTLGLSRDTSSTSQALLTLAPTADVAGMLNAILLTRYPDETERTRIVNQLIARQGLPATLLAPATIFGQRLVLLTEKSASIGWLGARNTLAFSGFYRRVEDIPDAVLAPVPVDLNTLQKGASFVYSHQATTLTALTGRVGFVRVSGLGAESSRRSDQWTGEVTLTRRFSAKSSGFVGLRYQDFQSNVPGVASEARENAAYLGLNHRF